MTKAKNDIPQLGRWEAFFNAFLNRPIEHFPRQLVGGKEQTITNEQILKEIGEGLADLDSGSDTIALDALIGRGRESLDEVKALTEYADQKSTRLLTVVTFFMALAGLLFVAFAKDHPVYLIWGGDFDPWQTVPALVDTLFGVFVLKVIAGALVIFHANQTRFRYPALTSVQPGAKPRSQIFFIEMIRVSPTDWAESFKERIENKGVPARDLSLRYAKSYIAESYLIAAKVADKLRYLQAAQGILGMSLKVLLLWFLLMAATSAFPPHVIAEAIQTKVEPSTQAKGFAAATAPVRATLPHQAASQQATAALLVPPPNGD